MTGNKKLKQAVRERMARTGESYTTALQAIRVERGVSAKPDGANVFRDIPEEQDPEYNRPGGCIVCGANPCIRATEMCAPCTFGEAGTAT